MRRSTAIRSGCGPRGFGVDHEVFLDQTTLQAFLGFIDALPK